MANANVRVRRAMEIITQHERAKSFLNDFEQQELQSVDPAPSLRAEQVKERLSAEIDSLVELVANDSEQLR